MRDDLIGYALGALEPEEHALIEARLNADPALRHDLELVTRSFQPLSWDKQPYEPPPALAHRTCEFVATQSRVMLAPAPTASSSQWRFADVAIAAALFLAATMLFFPALNQSRFAARVLGCQNNLREIGTALTNYADLHGGYFPNIAPEGRLGAAGVYATRLLEGGYLANQRVIVCPASALADEDEFRVPTSEELQNVPGEHLAQMHRRMGGSYGYNVGYVSNGRYYPTKNQHRFHFALMADAPSAKPPYRSHNHGNCGQNVLFEDLHVQYLTTCRARGCTDDIYLNDKGEVAAGIHKDDAVVAASHTKPLLVPVPVHIEPAP
jgi:hypothetical protein